MVRRFVDFRSRDRNRKKRRDSPESVKVQKFKMEMLLPKIEVRSGEGFEV